MEAFRSICHLAYSVPEFFAAEVPVQRFNEKENDEVRARYNLTLEDYPAFFLHRPGAAAPIRYDDAVQAPNLIRWLRAHDVMMPSMESIDELDAVANAFMSEPHQRHVEMAKQLAERYVTDAKAPMWLAEAVSYTLRLKVYVACVRVYISIYYETADVFRARSFLKFPSSRHS